MKSPLSLAKSTKQIPLNHHWGRQGDSRSRKPSSLLESLSEDSSSSSWGSWTRGRTVVMNGQVDHEKGNLMICHGNLSWENMINLINVSIYYIILYYIIVYYITLHYITLHFHIILYYIILHYIILYYVCFANVSRHLYIPCIYIYIISGQLIHICHFRNAQLSPW